MKSSIFPVLVLMAGPALAGDGPVYEDRQVYDPSFFAGVTWTFGGGPGVSLKYLTTNDPDEIGLSAGVTYNFDGSIGCDVGAAVNGDDVSLTVGYDFCGKRVQIGAGVTQDHGTETVCVDFCPEG